jgi:endoglucanase
MSKRSKTTTTISKRTKITIGAAMGLLTVGTLVATGIILSRAVRSAPILSQPAHSSPKNAQSRGLAPATRFFVPHPDRGAIDQIAHLTTSGEQSQANLIQAMVNTPQAVWFTSGDPKDVQQDVKQIAQQAAGHGAVPVLVAYDIPGRDCGQYSAGGAPGDAAYQAWISAFAEGIGASKAVVLLEPDALANLPSNCGANAYAGAPNPPTDGTRIADIKYAVKALEADPNVSVYLDAGHSAWQSVGTMAQRLVEAGVLSAQGFFLNVSNYQYTPNEVAYGTWVSECIALGRGSATYDYPNNCPSQYGNGTSMSPYGIWSNTASQADLNTAGINSRYTQMLGSTRPTAHFVVDTSRNGTGPNNMSTYSTAPFNQPFSVVSALRTGSWCNPTSAGLGLTPTADTSSVSPLLDAYLWVKTPGQSDGQCDGSGGTRAWDYSVYSQLGWPTSGPNPAMPAVCGGSTAGTCTFDPLWGTTDPAAGVWFSQQALQLAQNANPALPTPPK